MPHVRRTRYYAEQTAQAFPLLKPESVVTVCTEFMKVLFDAVAHGHEITVSQRGHVELFTLKIYREQFNVAKANLTAARGAGNRKEERRLRESRRRIRRDLGLGPAPDLFTVPLL